MAYQCWSSLSWTLFCCCFLLHSSLDLCAAVIVSWSSSSFFSFPLIFWGGGSDFSSVISGKFGPRFSSVQFSSASQSCLTLCDPVVCSMPGLPVHHQVHPGVYSHSCPLSRWCHPAISSSVVPFSSCPQSFPVSQLFASGGQSIGVSASASVLPMNIQDWSPLGWTGWISLLPRDSQESSPTPQFKSINSSALSFLCSPTLTSICDYWKNHSFD